MLSSHDPHSPKQQQFPSIVSNVTSYQALARRLVSSRYQLRKLPCYPTSLIFSLALNYRCKHEIKAFGEAVHIPLPEVGSQGKESAIRVIEGYRSRRYI